MTPTAFAQIIAVIEEEYGVRITESRQEIWFHLLNEYTDDQVRLALRHMLSHKVYGKPKVEDLLTVLQPEKPSHEQEEQLLEEEADAAIAWMRDNISNDYAADFGPCLNAVVQAFGGLQAIIDTFLADRWTFERARWIRLYKGIARRGVQGSEGDRLFTPRYAEHVAQNQERGLGEMMFPIPLRAFVPHNKALGHLPGRELILGQSKGLLGHSGGES